MPIKTFIGFPNSTTTPTLEAAVGATMVHNGIHNGTGLATLADASEICDSPLMRAMSGEMVGLDTLADLVSIATYEACLD